MKHCKIMISKNRSFRQRTLLQRINHHLLHSTLIIFDLFNTLKSNIRRNNVFTKKLYCVRKSHRVSFQTQTMMNKTHLKTLNDMLILYKTRLFHPVEESQLSTNIIQILIIPYRLSPCTPPKIFNHIIQKRIRRPLFERISTYFENVLG